MKHKPQKMTDALGQLYASLALDNWRQAKKAFEERHGDDVMYWHLLRWAEYLGQLEDLTNPKLFLV